MRTDVIIFGAELDGWVAAKRLQEYGYSVRMMSSGAGSLNYTGEGLSILGNSSSENGQFVKRPLDCIGQLNEMHPYRKIGIARIENALDWFTDISAKLCQPLIISAENEMAISAIGLEIPVCGMSIHQATFGQLNGQNSSIFRFFGHRDFPTELIERELAKSGLVTNVIEVDPPGDVPENAALAKSFDLLNDPPSYFRSLKDFIPSESQIVLFPAVIGIRKHDKLLSLAEDIFGLPCLEIPTLPPSVPGMRLESAFSFYLKSEGVAVQGGVGIAKSSIDEETGIIIWDKMGRRYEASTGVLSSGGVLMGGLEVDSYGIIRDTIFGLDVFQSKPLAAISVEDSLNALHMAGVETDSKLRPRLSGSDFIPNIFVTGRTLAHWNPGLEHSTEGVCIATGWIAAENAHRHMELMSNG